MCSIPSAYLMGISCSWIWTEHIFLACPEVIDHKRQTKDNLKGEVNNE